MVLVQKWPFFQLFFYGNIGQENVFYDILHRENAFVANKKKRSKSRKTDFFSKGLTHSFGRKMDNFSTFFFQAIEARKMSFTIFQNEKKPFQAIKTRTSKSRNIDIFPKGLTHGFCLKMALFSTFIFYVIQARKMSFTIFQKEKTPFQAIKTRSSKNREIDIIPKGLTNGFCQKMAVFLTFLFQAIQAMKMSFTIFQNEKTPFQTIKRRSSKTRKIEIFPRGLTHRFGLKMAIFPTFFLGNIGQENLF